MILGHLGGLLQVDIKLGRSSVSSEDQYLQMRSGAGSSPVGPEIAGLSSCVSISFSRWRETSAAIWIPASAGMTEPQNQVPQERGQERLVLLCRK